MTELSFLLDLFLNDEVPKTIKELIAKRIKDVEEGFRGSSIPAPALTDPRYNVKHPVIPDSSPVPPDQIAQTPAAAAAMAARAQVIAQAQSGVIEKGRTSPRKF